MAGGRVAGPDGPCSRTWGCGAGFILPWAAETASPLPSSGAESPDSLTKSKISISISFPFSRAPWNDSLSFQSSRRLFSR